MSRRALLSPRGCIFFFSPIGQVWITVLRLRRPFPTSGRLMWPWPPPPCSRCASRCQQVNIEVGQAGTNETLWWSKEPPATGHWLPRAQSLNYHKSKHLAKVLLGVLSTWRRTSTWIPPRAHYWRKSANLQRSESDCAWESVPTRLHYCLELVEITSKSPVNYQPQLDSVWEEFDLCAGFTGGGFGNQSNPMVHFLTELNTCSTKKTSALSFLCYKLYLHVIEAIYL